MVDRPYLAAMKHLVFAICGLPACAGAQEIFPDVLSKDIASLEAGVIYAPEAMGEAPAPGTIEGVTHIIHEEPPFAAVTRRVPAVLGVGFGTKSLAVDPDGVQGVFITVTHPPMGPNKIRSQTYESKLRGDSPSLTFFQFDHTYELVKGFWQFEATHDGRVLSRTTFEVVDPHLLPELAKICDFMDLLS